MRTGWSEDVYGATAPITLEGLRWVLFAEMLASDAKLDVDAATQHLDDQAAQVADMEFELGKPSENAARSRQRGKIADARVRLGKGRLQVAEMAKHKAATRALLWPFDPDEAEA